MEDATRFVPQCPRCGRTLPADAAEGLCAACLLLAGSETLPSASLDDTPTMSSADGVAAPRAPDALRLEPDQRWGPYRIGRLLGRGGMGEVYEAEQVDSGRRVALKVLRTRLHNADDRARFLREGQLAASISHPHTVYIFGSEEIDGVPVISMELLPGGTLKDRVAAHGPLPPREAVAAVLDVIGGLDAAQAAGVLHRDIKPSNCFVDRDGAVKVGDFGLSISTLARDVHHELATLGFEGTPQFAPPEQLRGEPLDVRADIYAVGATLYYLLTGRAPFDAPDLRQLFDAVMAEAPVPLRAIRRDVPNALASVVMQCLAKSPAERPASYAALAEALRPVAAQDEAPARLAPRVLASVLDGWIIIGVPAALVTTWVSDPMTRTVDRSVTMSAWTWLPAFAYYLLLEGQWGASLGKRLLGLRVIAANGTVAGWRQVTIRTAMFHLPAIAASLALAAGILTPDTTFDTARPFALAALAAALFFSTARRHNGWAGLHDVVSGARVVARAPVLARRAADERVAPAVLVSQAMPRRYGPFVATDEASQPAAGSIVRAFDPVLRRQVWIHLAAAGAPPIDAARRDVARVGRLHWLTGRRSSGENWDAFEAPDGAPILHRGRAAGEWPSLKLWLLDLTSELTSAERDGTMPPLALDRLWIRGDGRLVLLDFPAPGAELSARGRGERTPTGLLADLAAFARGQTAAAPAAMPLSARALLARWAAASVPALNEARAALTSVAAAPDRVQRWRRGLPLAIASAPVALMVLLSLAIVPALARFTTSDGSDMMRLLGALRNTNPPPESPMARPEVRQAAEVYVAGRYAELIRNDEFWNTGVIREVGAPYRPLAEEILVRHPAVTPAALAEADAVLAASRPRRNNGAGARELPAVELGGIIMSTVTAGALALVLLCSLLSAVLVPGGVVTRAVGLAVVTGSGEEVSRARSVARVLVAGVPAIAWLVYLAQSPKVQGFVPTPPSPILATGITLAVLAAGVMWTIAQPTRGPHDRLLGTWVVPR